MKKLRKMNKKGQALVEFVIILPIIMMIIFVIIDFTNVFYQKNHLESITNDVVVYKENGKSNEYIKNNVDKDINISYKQTGNSLVIKTKKKVTLVTPFSSLFFKNPYIIKTERTILYE